VVLVARDPTNGRLERQAVLDRAHRRADPLVACRKEAKKEDPSERDVDRRVLYDRAIWQHADRAYKSVTVGVPEVHECGVAYFLRGDGITLRELVLTERDGEVPRGGQARPDRRGGEGVDATALLPQVERWGRQLGAGLAVGRHEIGAGPHELAVEGPDELDVTVAVVVLPQRPNRKTGLVLLDRQLEPAVRRRPGVPRGAERAIGVVLVEEVALSGDELAAEEEKAARHLTVPREIEGIRDQRAIARAQVGVGVPVEAEDVRVVRGDDGAPVVDLRADDERRSLVQAVDVLGQMLGDRLVLVGPEPPVIFRPREK